MSQDETNQRQYFANGEHQGGLGVEHGILWKQEHHGVGYVAGHENNQEDGHQTVIYDR